MQHAIDIPAPAGADNETVSTALETAALFRAKGDGREAMRWLRRAAESAGEAGDDERALSLSRAVADLHDELEHQPAAATPAAPYPPPPSSRSAPPSPPSVRASHPPAASSRLSRPPLSSTRGSTPPRPSARPSYSRPPSVRPAAAPTAVASIAAAPTSATPQTESARSLENAPTNVVASAAQASAPEPARVVTLPSVSAPSPSAPPAVTLPQPKGARRAARVALEISTTKPGVLEARLLADGEQPRIGSTEAMIVLLDPTSHLLER